MQAHGELPGEDLRGAASKAREQGQVVPGTHMACAGDLKQPKDGLAQSIFPRVACTCHSSRKHTAI